MSASVIDTLLTRVKLLLDEPSLGAKYTNSTIVQDILPSAISEVYSRMSMDTDSPVYVEHQIDLVVGQQYYVLPPSIRQVERLIRTSSAGLIIADWRPEDRLGVYGEGWALQGNELRVFPAPTTAETWYIHYVPDGIVCPHKASDGTLSSDKLTMTLSASPTLGLVDRRPHAYAGQMLRRIPTSGLVEERIIASHDASAGTVTFRRPFTSASAGASSDPYEIVPEYSEALMMSLVYSCILTLGSARRLAQTNMENFRRDFVRHMKSEGDRVANIQGRRPKAFRQDTLDRDRGNGGDLHRYIYGGR